VNEAAPGPHLVRIQLQPAEHDPRPREFDGHPHWSMDLTHSLLDHEFLVRVVDASTRELLPAGTKVSFYSPGRGSARLPLRWEGHFVMKLPPVTCMLRFTSEGFLPRNVEVPMVMGGSSKLEVALQPER
jgi:hypothetical protein